MPGKGNFTEEPPGTLMKFLGWAADKIGVQTEYQFGPVSESMSWPLIDDDPTTEAPSLLELLGKVIPA